MIVFFLTLFFFLTGGSLAGAPPKNIPLPPIVPVFSEWEEAADRMEGEAVALEKDLVRLRAESEALRGDVRRLQREIQELKKKKEKAFLFFQESTLQEKIAELRPKAERLARLESDYEERLRRLQEKDASLIQLYDSRLEEILGSAGPFLDPALAESLMDTVVEVVGRRKRVEDRRKRWERGKNLQRRASTVPQDFPPLEKTSEEEQLRLAYAVLKDRKKRLEEEISRQVVEEAQGREELQLQEKMVCFLQDIQRFQETGSSAPGSGRSALLNRYGDEQELAQLRRKIQDIQKKREENQVQLLQVESYLKALEARLGEKGGKNDETP